MDIFDANAFIGKPSTTRIPGATADDLTDRMDRAGIKRSLVWHIAQHDCAPDAGNELLTQAVAGRDRLWGCWTILPPQTEEVVTVDFFDRMKQSGVVAIRAFPASHKYMLNGAVFGDFLYEVAERGIPLLLSLDFGGNWEVVYDMLEEYPAITCILCDLGSWNQDRQLWPLLEMCPNVFAETSMLSLQAGGVEATVKRFGSGRLVFGSGFPGRYPEAAILDLLHLPIPDSEKAAIASGNLSKLISEVML